MGLSVRTPEDRKRLGQAIDSGEGYVLQEIRLHLTRRCNLDCVMCRRGKPGSESETARILEIIDQAIPLGLKTVKFFGGEPLLRDDLVTLVRETTRRRLRSSITTNGVLLDPDRARSLVEAGLSSAAFSVDAPTPATHDRIRGIDGAWKRTVRGIDALVTARSTHPAIHLNTVVMRENIREAPGLIAFCRDHGVDSLSLIPVSLASLDADRDATHGEKTAHRLLPTPDDIRWWNESAAPQIITEAQTANVLITEENAWIFGQTAREHRAAEDGRYVDAYLETASCLRPWFHLTIDTALDVFACRRVCDPAFRPLGSLDKAPLKEIWEGEKCRGFRLRARRPSFPECRYCCLPVMLGNREATRRYLR